MMKDITKKFLEKELGLSGNLILKDQKEALLSNVFGMSEKTSLNKTIGIRRRFTISSEKYEEQIDNIKFKMVYCEKGIDSFFIGETEVTQELYERVMEIGRAHV